MPDGFPSSPDGSLPVPAPGRIGRDGRQPDAGRGLGGASLDGEPSVVSQPRLVLIGGSSAEGFGVEEGMPYASVWAAAHELGFVPFIRQAIRVPHALEFVTQAALTPNDLLVLHLGLVDCDRLPAPDCYRAGTIVQRGRDRLDVWETDRRLWSRVRRALAVSVKRVLAWAVVRAANQTHRRPGTSLSDFRDGVIALEAALADFPGLVVCVIPDRVAVRNYARYPKQHGKRPAAITARAYSEVLRTNLVDARARRRLPVEGIELSGILAPVDYQADGFHLNAGAHLKVVQAGSAAIQAGVGRATG